MILLSIFSYNFYYLKRIFNESWCIFCLPFTMTEINSSLPSEIDDFFDNIPENEEDLTGLFTKIAINKARELLVSDLDSVDNNSESTGWDTSSALTIASGSTEAEDEIEIPQTSSSNLTPCALIDIINGSIQRCGETKNLRGLVQLISTWQIDSDAIREAGKELENLGVCQTHFMFDQNRLHKKGAKKEQNIEHGFFLVVGSFVVNIQFLFE